MRLLIAFVGLCLAVPALAQDKVPVTAFGLEIGEAVRLPECLRAEIARGVFSTDVYKQSTTFMCAGRPGYQPDVGYGFGEIMFPLENLPEILGFPIMQGQYVSDKIEGISASTLSYLLKDHIISELTKKFGKPVFMAVRKTSFTNLRVAVDQTVAEWEVGDVTIVYESNPYDYQNGSLNISSSKLLGLKADAQRKQDAQKVPL